MRKIFIFSAFFLFLYSCKKESPSVKYDTSILSDYIKSESEQFVLINQLIACAASTDLADPEQSTFPISIFYYPIKGAYDIKYFEINNAGSNQSNYANYTTKDLQQVPVFNGYLGRFKSDVSQDTWCIVTYKTLGKLHICNPIKIKHYSQPTIFASQVITVLNNGVQPKFSWIDSTSINNSIYFQVVSDTINNLISGTYTYDKYWNFYDLSNVVLNIRDVSPIPTLANDTKYNLTLMGVSKDNWVNIVGQKEFKTPY
jgi:hypothetical protein